MGLGLNIVVGFAGLLDLGYVAFYAVGAYATAVLTSPASPAFAPHLDFWIALPLVMAIAAAIGLTIGAPVLRLRGDYLAIVTLGFGEIARIVLLSQWMTPYVGGPQGILNVPAPQFLGKDLRDPALLYYPIMAACIVAALVAISLASSRVGRAWTAMREDESVAEATGVNTIKYKLLAFSMGATFGGLAGAFYAVRIGTVFPQELNIIVSINALALIILGGVGSIPGVIVGAVVLVGLPELLREFSEYRLLLYGIVLVAMMLLRPEGFLPNRSRRAELHEGEDEGGPPGWDEKRWEAETGVQTPEPEIT
jgi:branched-chain amino acid transport system permease protein